MTTHREHVYTGKRGKPQNSKHRVGHRPHEKPWYMNYLAAVRISIFWHNDRSICTNPEYLSRINLLTEFQINKKISFLISVNRPPALQLTQ